MGATNLARDGGALRFSSDASEFVQQENQAKKRHASQE
jgi:hypothetical protein